MNDFNPGMYGVQVQQPPEFQNPVMQPAGAPGSDAAMSSAIASPGAGFFSNPANIAGLISMMGQAGAAISPDDTIGRRLGGVAANMGSQKLQQMASAEAEKRQMEFYKKLFEGKTPTQIETIKTDIAQGKTSPIGEPTTMLSQTPNQIGNVSQMFNPNYSARSDLNLINPPQLGNNGTIFGGK